MKHLRTKLLAAVAMLAIAAIMMTTASYAWFTISTNPEISDIKANVTANGNLEIQLAKVDDDGKLVAPAPSAVGDAGKNQTWGNLVELEEAFKVANNGAAKFTLKPVLPDYATNAQVMTFKYPTFGLDGRIKDTDDLTKTRLGNGTSTNKFSDFNGGVYTFNGDTTAFTGNSGAWCFEVDFWIRTNVSGNDITLCTSRNRDDNAPAGSAEKGLGSFIDYSTTPENKDIVSITVIDTGITCNYAGTISGNGSTPAAGTRYDVTIGTLDGSAKGELTMDTIALTQDVAKLIRVYVYMDGTSLQNKDFLNSDISFDLNLQFTGDVALDDMNPTQSEYGADSAYTNDPATTQGANRAPETGANAHPDPQLNP